MNKNALKTNPFFLITDSGAYKSLPRTNTVAYFTAPREMNKNALKLTHFFFVTDIGAN